MKSKNLPEVSLSIIAKKPMELPDKEVILDKLAKLPGALFEKLVCRFDKYNSVPGRESAQLLRATDLLRLVESLDRGISSLWEKLCEITSDNGTVDDNLSNAITPTKVEKLIGILIAPEDVRVGEEISRYAFAQVHNTVNSDLLQRFDELVVSALIWNLADVPAQDTKYPLLLAFAVLCHDHALGLGKSVLKEKLKTWIENVCENSPFSVESIRANYPAQQYERLYRLAIEIAWSTPISKSSKNIMPPEAYIRWGTLRQRIGYDVFTPDRHQALTELLDWIMSDKSLGLIQVDHVEIILNQVDMQIPWEYKPGVSIDDEDPDLQPYPMVVRSNEHAARRDSRPCPHNVISEQHIACSHHHGEHFLEIVQDRGVFVTSTYSPHKVKKAVSLASVGVWSRTEHTEEERLREILIDCPVEDVPRRIHGRRKISESGSIWRDVVVLFDPNLPPFKFSYEEYDSAHQLNTNAALS